MDMDESDFFVLAVFAGLALLAVFIVVKVVKWIWYF
jgi:hypothetical protein